MAQIKVEWTVLGAQEVLKAQADIRAGDKRATADAKAEAEVRKQVAKAESDAKKAASKAESDAAKKAAKDRAADEEFVLRAAERARAKDERDFIAAQQRKTREMKAELREQDRAAKLSADYQKKSAQDTHNAIIRGLGLSGYYGPGRPTQMLEGIVGGLKGLVSGGLSTATGLLTGAAAAGIGIGTEEMATNADWSTQLAHNQRGDARMSKAMIAMMLRSTAAQSGVSESKIGAMSNAYAQGGGMTTQSSMDFLAKMQMLLPHSDITGIAQTAGQLSSRVGERGMQQLLASAYKTGNMEEVLPHAQELFQKQANAGIRSSDLMGMMDIMRVERATQGKFKSEKEAGSSMETLLEYATKHRIMGGTLGETISNVSGRLDKTTGVDAKGNVRINESGLELKQFSEMKVIIDSTKDMMDQFGKLDDSMNLVNKDAEEMNSEPMHELRKAYNQISATFGEMLAGPTKKFADFISANKSNMEGFFEGVTDRLGDLIDMLGTVDFSVITDFLQSIGMLDPAKAANNKAERLGSEAAGYREHAKELRKAGKGTEADAFEQKARVRDEQSKRYGELGAAIGVAKTDFFAGAGAARARQQRIDDARAHLDVARVGGEFGSAGTLSGAFRQAGNQIAKVTLDEDSKKHNAQTLTTLKEIHATLKAQPPRGPAATAMYEQPK